MSTAAIAEEVRPRTRRPHADAGIVFGSAATAQTRKPDSVRTTCEAIGLARSTYYFQSHRFASAIELEQKIVLRLHELRDIHPNDGHSTCGTQYLTHSYRELLRQYGLVPSVGEAVSGRAPDIRGSGRATSTHKSRQIIELSGYDTWKDALDRPKQFIESVYCSDRMDSLLGKFSSATDSPRLAPN